MTPYIGITDIPTPSHARLFAELLSKRLPPGSPRMLMVGIMMSRKTLNGLPSSWTGIFPANEKVADIFVSHPRCFNTLHYADFDGEDVLENLRKATRFGGPNLHAIQLDMVWPNPDELTVYTREYPFMRMVLQANLRALAQVHDSPEELVERLKRYEDSIDYILLDKSMGRGLGMDSAGLRPFAEAVMNNFPNLGITAAGGLGPDTLGLVEPLVKEIPGISIDAQGKLRPSGSARDPIDLILTATYVERAAEMFGRYEQT